MRFWLRELRDIIGWTCVSVFWRSLGTSILFVTLLPINHGTQKWIPPVVVTFQIYPFHPCSTSMTMVKTCFCKEEMMREGISGTVVLGTRAELSTIQLMFWSAPATNGKLWVVEYFTYTPENLHGT